ncbi:HipA family kinase [Halalkalibacter alkalisediminis]|uniref:HipA family kinase n=1 Tax=Halalkalibacter alkalisediminis TaxID=935616 RepID=A0ABV6NE68_9BACI|nr:HipA family kinase [Halalkalibacter alkalisediminis]
MKPISYKKLFESKTNNAHLISFDDGNDYVVKLYKESESKALINEWIAYCIARFLMLPIPYSYLVEIPMEFFEAMPKSADTQFTSKQFASKYIDNCKNGHEVNVTDITNNANLASIIVFDYWLYNIDRTRKNILLQESTPGSHYCWIIDNADSFGSLSWTTNDLENRPQTLIESATHEMLAKHVKKEEDFKKAIQLIQVMPTQLLEEVVSHIPEDWNLTTVDKKEIIKTLNYRRYFTLHLIIEKFLRKVYRPLHRKNS